MYRPARSSRPPREVIAAKYVSHEEKTGLTIEGGRLVLVPSSTAIAGQRSAELTRKLCPYPAEAVYRGRGDQHSADSYVCRRVNG